MENSILTSTKKILGLDENYTAFDPDIIMHINSAFSTLNQLGIGPVNGLFITDKTKKWEDLGIPENQLAMVRTLIYLKVRMIFDPPTLSFVIDGMKEQIREHEWRLSVMRDEALAALGGA
jgi:hypothetical protein